MKGRVLVVAGSDSGGGAGIQADIKAITAMGAYAATAVTALTAQDTEGVRAVHPVPLDFLRLQISMSLDDIGADCVKTGMLADAATIEAVCDALAGARLPVVADPVMVATSGARLLDPGAVETLKRRLVPLAAILTPNLPEAEVLSGMAIPDLAAMRHAAEAMLTLGVPAVLLKGGHPRGRAARRAGDRGGGGGLREPADRDAAHPWHRLHPGLRDRGRAGAGDGAAGFGGAGAGLCGGGDPLRPGLRAGERAAGPWRDGRSGADRGAGQGRMSFFSSVSAGFSTQPST